MMMNTERTVWQVPHAEDMGYREEFGILSGAWGPGLAAGRIYEMHSGLGLDMIKIALHVAADAVKRGLNVAYFDVKRVLSLDLEKEYVWDKVPDEEADWGQFDVICPSTFDQAVFSFHNTFRGSIRHDLVIIDSFTDLQVGSSSPYAEDPDEMLDFQECSLLHCRDWITRTQQSVLLLNHVAPITDQIGVAQSSEGTLRLDGVCDVRTALARRCSNDSQDDRRPSMAASDLVAWNTTDHRTDACTGSWPKRMNLKAQ